MLAVPKHLLVLYVSGNSLQEYFLHNLPMEWGETDKPVVLQFLILILLEDKCNIHLFPYF